MSETTGYKQSADAVTDPPTGPWDSALDTLREWDPIFAELCFRMNTNPWTHSVLPRKFIELVSVSLNTACTNLNSDGTRHHIRAALEAGATREEILFALKCGSILSIHSCSLAAPIVFEEAKAANVQLTPRANTEPTPACDAMRKIGQWNTAWDPFFALDPVFTDEFMAMGASLYKSGVMSPKEAELLSIALDASVTHMYAPGTRRHIQNALKAGATMEEIMEVLKLCVVQGVQTFNVGLPILAEELERHSSNQNAA
ncbi:MAG: carboxymuconolactone decarboxylase family protein [Candidatus Sulfotelmatobacter sp.]